MSREQNPFYEELFQVSEIDCKVNEFFNVKHPYCGIDLISDVKFDKMDESHKSMLSKIISLCGYSIENCRKIHLSHGDEISSALRNKETKYVMAFINFEYLKKLHFKVKKQTWTRVNDKKLIINQSITDFAIDSKAKSKFWKAMQIEFENAKNY